MAKGEIDIDMAVGIAVANREGKIHKGIPKDQAWKEYFKRLDELYPPKFFS